MSEEIKNNEVEDVQAQGEESSKLAQANSKVTRYVLWSMGAGVIPVPIVDMMAITGVQLKMISEITAVYEVPFSENMAKSYITALIGSVLPGSLAASGFGSLIKAIPGIGSFSGAVSQSLLAGAITFAIGKVFAAHFEMGGNLLNFNVDKSKTIFKEQFEKGKEAVKKMTAGKKDKAEAKQEK
ncbi:DUF697 domain-containing protein [Candidatus Dependentiae bacterium]|nr:DUF697 domain-containing protein [Candidatus Dependentiae bacterium]